MISLTRDYHPHVFCVCVKILSSTRRCSLRHAPAVTKRLSFDGWREVVKASKEERSRAILMDVAGSTQWNVASDELRSSTSLRLPFWILVREGNLTAAQLDGLKTSSDEKELNEYFDKDKRFLHFFRVDKVGKNPDQRVIWMTRALMCGAGYMSRTEA